MNEPPAFRTHGELARHGAPPVSDTELELMLLAVMPEPDRVVWKETGDADFAYEVPGLARFRCNAARERRGPAAVIRVVPAHITSAAELELPEAIQRLCRSPRGLILVSGPTGSGKSTTLGALVDLINRERSGHIVTIEDPIELIHESRRSLVTQRQVRLHTAGTAAALRAALREDPDVIVVGDIGELDTLTLALETAETGHLVLATMRTTTATRRRRPRAGWQGSRAAPRTRAPSTLAAARAGDAFALAELARWNGYLARGLVLLVFTLAPELFVLGTIAAAAGETLCLAPVRDEVRRRVWPFLAPHLRIEASALGEELPYHAGLGVALGVAEEARR